MELKKRSNHANIRDSIEKFRVRKFNIRKCTIFAFRNAYPRYKLMLNGAKL
mgnify:FL=1